MIKTVLFSQSPNIVITLTIIFIIVTLCTTVNIIYLVASYLTVITVLILLYRDPKHPVITDKRFIYSPSDGKITKIIETKEHYIINSFLSPLDVHVQYFPTDGTITNIVHKPGKFNAAFLEKSKHNERLVTTLSTSVGEITVVQIAGVLFRCSVNFNQIGDQVEVGKKLGMIKFGSRVDTYLLKSKVNLLVKNGDKLTGGMSKIAVIK